MLYILPRLWVLSKRLLSHGPGLCIIPGSKKRELDEFWKRASALSPSTLAKLLYSEEVAKLLRGVLKHETGIYFQLEDVTNGLFDVINNPVDMGKPRLKKLK